jgi:hypothetical protein
MTDTTFVYQLREKESEKETEARGLIRGEAKYPKTNPYKFRKQTYEAASWR